MAEIISFDGLRRRYAAQGPRSQLAGAKGVVGSFHGNQHTEASYIRMLLHSDSFRSVARKHPLKERGLLSAVKEVILMGTGAPRAA